MSGQMGSKKAGGSRFAILNEDMEEVIAAVATQSTDGSQGKVSAKKVLAEFSNRTFVSIKQPNTTANKYLVNHNTDKEDSNVLRLLHINIMKSGVSVSPVQLM
ncbi:hypothetical protein QYF36_011444 [Acer negundo]|nr:hypothetical protein QYF36_011444 [Acer negundo]